MGSAFRNGLKLNEKRDEALIADGDRQQRIVLAKPQTFMNRSGTAVRDLLDEYHGERGQISL